MRYKAISVLSQGYSKDLSSCFSSLKSHGVRLDLRKLVDWQVVWPSPINCEVVEVEVALKKMLCQLLDNDVSCPDSERCHFVGTT